MANVRIGISGWTYKPWRGQFYPHGLAQKKELSCAPMTDGHFIHGRQPKLGPRDVFLCFDNTDKLQAPREVVALMKQLGQA